MNCDGVPPDAATWNRPASRIENTIRPSLDQAALNGTPVTSQILDDVLRRRSNTRIVPELKKATDLLSGDQNGEVASAVPGRRRACVSSSGRNHNPAPPPATALKTTACPSGDTAKPPAA